MDASETYLKMSDWDEVQGLAELLSLESKQGSTFVKADDHNVIIWSSNIVPIFPRKTPPIRFIRLFHQDQLQEMVFDEEEGLGVLLDKFVHWAYIINAHNIDQSSYHVETWIGKTPFTSMEQLWLAFVMKSLYSKVWSGSDWVQEVLK